ncbi:MAG: signal peptidase I, partial [Kineosporiaceae bacterium]
MNRTRHIGGLAVQFLAVLYLTVVVSLLFWSHAPQLIGWHPRVVITGSMMPVIAPGDVSVIGPAEVGPATLPRGRIVLVSAPAMRSGYYLHRVLRYTESGQVITKGDANRIADSDPVAREAIRGQLRLVVPLVGRPVIWLAERNYPALLAAGVGTWVSLVIVMGPLPRRRPGVRTRA